MIHVAMGLTVSFLLLVGLPHLSAMEFLGLCACTGFFAGIAESLIEDLL